MAGALTVIYCPDTTTPFPNSPGMRNEEGPNLNDAQDHKKLAQDHATGLSN
jgi:hypothetical protein